MAYQYQDLVYLLQYWGVQDVLLPFLLIFTIVFAVLQKTRIMGKDKKQFNVILAFVIALSVVIPHVTGSYPFGVDVIDIINAIIPQIALIIVVLIMMLILVGVFAPASAGVIALVGALLVLFIFLGTTEYMYSLSWFYNIFGEDVISLLVILLVFGLIVWYITSEPKADSPGGELVKELGKLWEKD